MNKKVAIRVKDEDHGAKVIKYLESIGGTGSMYGDVKGSYYFINKGGNIEFFFTILQGYTEIELPEEKTFPRKMLVWDYIEREEREIHGHIGTLGYPWVDYDGVCWKYAEELPEKEEIEEMTLEEVCKVLGKEVKIVK